MDLEQTVNYQKEYPELIKTPKLLLQLNGHPY